MWMDELKTRSKWGLEAGTVEPSDQPTIPYLHGKRHVPLQPHPPRHPSTADHDALRRGDERPPDTAAPPHIALPHLRPPRCARAAAAV